MKKLLDRRSLLLALGVAAICIGCFLLERFQNADHRAFQTTAVAPDEFRAWESQSSPQITSAPTETPPGTPASAISGALKKLTAEPPRRADKMSGAPASGPTEVSRVSISHESLPKLTTNVSHRIPERSNFKDWNHAESVAQGQTPVEAASKAPVRDPEVQALQAALESSRSAFITGQKELQRKLADADESTKEEIRWALNQDRDTFLAEQSKLRDQIIQFILSKDAPRR